METKKKIEAARSDLVVTGEPTEGTTGAFEVKAVKTGKVYHTKLGGEGYLHNDEAKLKKVIDAILADFPKSV